MRIHFTRSGGFTGMKLSTALNTEELPPEQAAEVDKLVGEAAFFELPERLLPERPQPDRFHYQVTVEAGEKSRSVECSEATVPDSLRPLLNYLTTYAMVDRKR